MNTVSSTSTVVTRVFIGSRGQLMSETRILGRVAGRKSSSPHSHQLKGKSSSRESEKLLIQNGLSHDTFWKKELPDGHGREGGVGDGTHGGIDGRGVRREAARHPAETEVSRAESAANDRVDAAEEARGPFEGRALLVVGHKGADGRAVGGPVSATAVEKRFTPPLVDFLRDVLSLSLPQGVAAEPVSVALLERFTAVFIGDSSSIALPDELQQEFSSCGGTEGSGWTAWKIQVRWNLKTGERPLVLIEAGRASDAKSPIAQQEVQPGALEIFDLGDFSLDRFRRWDAGQASYISRLPHGTTVLDELGQVVNLREFLSAPAVGNVVEVPVLLGINDRLPSRLIAVRVPEEVAHRRRQKGREKAAKNGRGPAAEDGAMWGWSLFRDEPFPRATDVERRRRAVPSPLANRAAVQAVPCSIPKGRTITSPAIVREPLPKKRWRCCGRSGRAHCCNTGCCCRRPGRTTAAACSEPTAPCAIGSARSSEPGITMTNSSSRGPTCKPTSHTSPKSTPEKNIPATSNSGETRHFSTGTI